MLTGVSRQELEIPKHFCTGVEIEKKNKIKISHLNVMSGDKTNTSKTFTQAYTKAKTICRHKIKKVLVVIIVVRMNENVL